MSALEGSLADLEERIAKLERKAAPLRERLAPIDEQLDQLRKSRQAKLAGELGGKAKRRPKHDYESAFQAYDAHGGRGALKATSETHRIPMRTLSWALDRRSKV